MKKFVSILLALVMVLSLGTVAFAAEDTNKTLTAVTDDAKTTEVTENAASFDVKTQTNLVEGSHANISYYVNVEWLVDTSTIDINKGDLYKWDPLQLKYVKDETTTAGDVGEHKSVGVKITLTNSSNAAVDYAITYADNDADKLTTTEAAKTDSAAAATGTLANADTTTAATAADDSGYAYVIDIEKIGTGKAQQAVYTAAVTVDSVADGDTTADGAELKLGTYTVTLSEYVEPEPEVKVISTIADILATVPNFPTSSETAWKDTLGQKGLYLNAQYLSFPAASLPLSAPVTEQNGNYVTQEGSFEGNPTYKATFTMENGVLKSITAETDLMYIFNVPQS